MLKASKVNMKVLLHVGVLCSSCLHNYSIDGIDGGPLYQGQIEDYNGRCHVMCPWHSYMFDLKTGANDLGLQQDVYECKCVNGQLYIYHDSELSLGSYVINPPVKS